MGETPPTINIIVQSEENNNRKNQRKTSRNFVRNRGAYGTDTEKNQLITKQSDAGTALRHPANHLRPFGMSAEASNSLRRLFEIYN